MFFAIRLTGISTALSLCVESVGLESPFKEAALEYIFIMLSENVALEYIFIPFVRKGGIGIQIHHLCQKGSHWNVIIRKALECYHFFGAKGRY